MSANMIDKDFLNMEKCREDLLFHAKGKWHLPVLTAITLAILVGSYHICVIGYPAEEWLLRLFPFFWLIPVGYLAGFGIRTLRKRLWIAKTKFTVAEDTLLRTEAIMVRPHGRYRSLRPDLVFDHWEIHFSEHGTFKATMTHATWSKKGNCMNCTSLVKSAEPGDKYYLILDERVKEGQPPKIVLAYPCKYFEGRENG